MNSSQLKIREGAIQEVVDISLEIPEFDNPYNKEVYEQRLNGKIFLIAIAEINGQLAGFKVGYDKFGSKTFYTWMGGVLPDYRNAGVARALAKFQEQFAKNEGFETVLLKTRNRHKAMLHFALNSGFQIIEVESRPDVSENRILLKKSLLD